MKFIKVYLQTWHLSGVHFFADGSCGSYEVKSGMKYSWAINKKDNILLERCANILRICEPKFRFQNFRYSKI